MKTLTLFAAILVAAGCNMSAAILYGPTPIGSSVRSSDFGSNNQSGFRAFDNFTVASGATVQKVTWSGLWIDFASPTPAPAPAPDVLTWDLAFYADNGGVPGAELSFQSFAAADVTSTFQGNAVFSINGLFNVALYQYSVDLTNPFLAAPATQYWFSVLARSADFNPAFALRGAVGGDDSSYQQQLGPGLSIVNANAVARDRAIVLEGTVPEPGTLLITAAALLLIPALRRFR